VVEIARDEPPEEASEEASLPANNADTRLVEPDEQSYDAALVSLIHSEEDVCVDDESRQPPNELGPHGTEHLDIEDLPEGEEQEADVPEVEHISALHAEEQAEEELAEFEDRQEDEERVEEGLVAFVAWEEEQTESGSFHAVEESEERQTRAREMNLAQLAKLEALVREASEQGPRIHWKKTDSWANRAFRGDIEVSSTRALGVVTTLAVFGDALLLFDSKRFASGLIAGATGGLIPTSANSHQARRRRRLLSVAASSTAAESRLPGARRLALPDIKSVRIERQRAWALKLTICMTNGEDLEYRFPFNRRRQVVRLLTPVLGPRLLDK
jgi:hypothetical protein